MSSDTPSVSDRPSAGWQAPALTALLVLLVVAVYWPTLFHSFIWDDDVHVSNNLLLRYPGGLKAIWVKWRATPQYYPLVHTSFWLEYRLWGLQPMGYHAVNMLLHAGSVVLLWRILVRLAVPGAWLAAALFAVHPVTVESVAWVSERKNVLSLALALGSIAAYLRFLPPDIAHTEETSSSKPTGWWYELSLVLFIGALLSKTVTASLPAVLLVIIWWKQGRITLRDVTPLVPFFGFGIALAGVTVWLERTHVGAEGEEWQLTFVERVLLAGRAAWFYAGKLAWPYPLMFFYPRWTPDASSLWQYAFPAAVVGLLLGLWLSRGRIGRGPLAAALIFGGVLVPALGFFNVYPFRYSFVADHFQYHASIALLTLAAAAIALAAERLARGGTRWAAVLVLVPLAVVAHRQTLVFHTLEALYEHNIALYPQSWVSHYNLGVELEAQGRTDEAIAHYRSAIASVPPDQWYRTVGPCLMHAENLDQAAAELARVLRSSHDDSQRAGTLANLAAIHFQQRHNDQAIQAYLASLKLRPDHARTLYNLALVLRESGNLDAAIERARDAVRVQPAFAEAQHGLGTMLMAARRPVEAVAPLQTAAALRPETPEYRHDLEAARKAAGAPRNAP